MPPGFSDPRQQLLHFLHSSKVVSPSTLDPRSLSQLLPLAPAQRDTDARFQKAFHDGEANPRVLSVAQDILSRQQKPIRHTSVLLCCDSRKELWPPVLTHRLRSKQAKELKPFCGSQQTRSAKRMP